MMDMIHFTKGFVLKGSLVIIALMFLLTDPGFWLPSAIGLPNWMFEQVPVFYIIDFLPIFMLLACLGLVVYLFRETIWRK